MRLPILDWSRSYSGETALRDAVAALIVTIMLIPQSLAYALLAGLPPETGLYASMLPLLAYALFGSSRTLAVGPVAVVSLMTAAAIGKLGLTRPEDAIVAAIALALLSGGMLLLMGLFRLGFLANLLSHPVVAGFITASGILIALSQLRHILGIEGHGHTLPDLVLSLGRHAGDVHGPTVLIGLAALGFLFWVRRGFEPLLRRAGLPPRGAGLLAKAGPILAIAGTTVAVWGLDLGSRGVAIVGQVPAGLPPLGMPSFDPGLWRELALPAFLISIIGFVESVAVARTLAAKRRQTILPDQELIGLGAANVASAVSGGFPVTGGFARSVVNFDAGAETPAAGALAALGLAVAALFLTPLLHFLPRATLAATIIVAVLSLVDFGVLRQAWSYSRADFAAVSLTILATLVFGVEVGVSAGVLLSILLHLWRTARPHFAEVGRVPGTEHFRNVLRHEVETAPHLVTLRIDESLYFANAAFLEDRVLSRVAADPALTDVVLLFSAVNAVDLSALHTLETLSERLAASGVRLHLSEVKGPVMDRLVGTALLERLTGEVFLSQHAASRALGGR